MHFQEWWTRHRAHLPALGFESPSIDQAEPAPGVIEALNSADIILFAPSNPVVSIGPILAVPGIAAAIQESPAAVVGVSPIIAGSPVRGMADACLAALDIPSSASAVGLHYGPRTTYGLLDTWLIAEEDSGLATEFSKRGLHTLVRPLWMRDTETSVDLASAALDAALPGPATR